MSTSPAKSQKDGEKEMPFFDHLEELRWHLIRSLLSIVIFGVIIFIFKEFVFGTIIFGPRSESFLTYRLFCQMSEHTCMSPPEFEMIATKVGERFLTHLKVSFWLGFILSFPYIFWEFWRFISPGLLDSEKKAAKGIVFSCSFLFFLGVAFGYFIITPFGLKFLTEYTLSSQEIVTESSSLTSYVGYLTNFTIPSGMLFQMPIAVYILSRIGLLTPDLMKKYRRHALVGIIVLAAIITPPEVVTQILIAIPIFLLYEFSIMISRRAAKKYNTT